MSSPGFLLGAHTWIRDQPVRKKLALFGVAAALTAAVIASAVLLVNRLYLLRLSYRADTLAINRIVAENAIGPVAFQDSTAAAAVLSTLRARPTIRGAVIDLPDKKNFATFGDPPSENVRLPAGETDAYDGWILHTSAPIGDDAAGTVHLVSDLRPVLWDAVRAFALALVAALALALAFSAFVGGILRRFILAPVENLHAVAHRVAEKADYRERAVILGQDEIGQLTATFNHMLDRLQANDAALRASNEGLNQEIAARQRLEGQLLESSRLAGMAQVATSVLHNVGNVLNSVNISANLMRDTLANNAHFALLAQTTTLLREQGDRLPHFIADDPRGRLLPTFFLKLGEQIASIQANLLGETDLLSQNIDHIKQIVSLQQNHARGGGVILAVAPATLFSDALRIVHASLVRHGVVVSSDLTATPDIVTDRHEVLQIIVNFLTNAVDALKPRPADSRLLRLAVIRREHAVEFVVEDNGVGIAPGNLPLIFRHGFTTRRDGHGFGLHSGSIAARNLGGKLHAHSEGLGCGARFTLTLPFAPPPPVSPTTP